MPHAPAHRRPTAAPIAAVRLTLGQRVVQRRGVRGRRGVILIFTVVLLTLLAIMGTAYLATSRIDRQQVTGRGSLPQQAANSPLLKDASTLDKLHAGVERAVEGELVRDLFNVPRNLNLDSDYFAGTSWSKFRQVVGTPSQPVSWYENYDASGRADPWLSSLLPRRAGATDSTPVWPWIGGPLGVPVGTVAPNIAYNNDPAVTAPFAEPFFSDPRALGTGGFLGNANNYYAPIDPNEVFPGTSSTLPQTIGDNTATDNAAVARRYNARISAITIGRTSATDTVNTVRTYPALVPGTAAFATGAVTYLAGDADGDGIADGGLMPIAINPQFGTNTVNRYLDTTNNVIYFASYRIVDNSAKINLNTALDHRGDVVEMSISAKTSTDENADTGDHSAANYSTLSNATPATGGTPPPELREYLTDDPNLNGTSPAAGFTTPTVGAIGPNYGFFRSNVGLKGLVRQLMTPMNQAPDANEYNRTPSQSDLRLLIDSRFPLLRKVPGTAYQQTVLTEDKDIGRVASLFTNPAYAQFGVGTAAAPNGTQPAFYPLKYLYRSFGDLLETQLARRPFSPGGYLFQSNDGSTSVQYRSDALTPLDYSDAVALGAKGGALRNPLVPAGRGENALQFSLSINTPNTTFNGDSPWPYFPANAYNLWFGWTQDFDVDPTAGISTLNFPIRSLDATNAVDRAYTWSGITTDSGYDANFPPGAQKVTIQRSPRALFTGYNGVTSVAPRRGDRLDFTAPTGGTAVVIPTDGLPVGMPAYSAAETHPLGNGASVLGADPSTDFYYPPVKVSAATGTKEQLWRAFWSAMTVQVPFTYTTGGTTYYGSMWDAARPNGQPGSAITTPSSNWTSYNPNQFYNAFRSSDRWPSDVSTTTTPTNLGFLQPAVSGNYDERLRPTQTLSTRQMALLRSAVAACNTIDLRDSDNDITAMDVDLTDDNTETTTRYYARVYGTEKQLVITGVYLENDTFGAVEIFNPTDLPIQLSAYRIASVQRTADTNMKAATAEITLTPGTAPMRLSTDSTEYVQPNGYAVVYSPGGNNARFANVTNVAGNSGTNNPKPNVWAIPDTSNTLLTLAASGTLRQELVLLRTRRADGVAFKDSTATGVVRNAIENEFAVSANGTADDATQTKVETLVPLDSVDCRFTNRSPGTQGNTPARFLYLKPRPKPAQDSGSQYNPLLAGDQNNDREWAWRCFYSGKFYDLRPAAGPRIPAVPADGAAFTTDKNYAWTELQSGKVIFGPDTNGAWNKYDPSLGRNNYNTMPGPAIPIQTFTPFDPYTQTALRTVVTVSPANYNQVWGSDKYTALFTANNARDLRGVLHPLNEFPFGSPFARDGDLMAIPYIGTYKIYRADASGTKWAEFVSLSTDAWMVADDPNAVAQPVAGGASLNPAQTTTVGRFDPGITRYANEWASSLTDFVTARQAPYQTNLPDLPSSEVDATFVDTKGTTGTGSTNDQRYAQDGPVTGNGAVNPFPDARWTNFVERNNTAVVAKVAARAAKKDLVDGANVPLVQGVVNLNTAPQIVLRQLPWMVSSRTGQVDFLDNSPGGAQFRLVTNTIDAQRETLARAAWNGSTTTSYGQLFSFPSLMAMARDATIAPQLRYIYNQNTNTITDIGIQSTDLSADSTFHEKNAYSLLKGGTLNPVGRPEYSANYQVGLENATRVSNLTSTRSDVYTVYVTVQAWTWDAAGNGANQATTTRLVGERRSSFVVDRSQISQVKNKISDLIVLPIEKE